LKRMKQKRPLVKKMKILKINHLFIHDELLYFFLNYSHTNGPRISKNQTIKN